VMDDEVYAVNENLYRMTTTFLIISEDFDVF